ncbi:MAG: hypothetical protein WBA74_08795 [Cyclobacteriaceae bacterium]
MIHLIVVIIFIVLFIITVYSISEYKKFILEQEIIYLSLHKLDVGYFCTGYFTLPKNFIIVVDGTKNSSSFLTVEILDKNEDVIERSYCEPLSKNQYNGENAKYLRIWNWTNSNLPIVTLERGIQEREDIKYDIDYSKSHNYISKDSDIDVYRYDNLFVTRNIQLQEDETFISVSFNHTSYSSIFACDQIISDNKIVFTNVFTTTDSQDTQYFISSYSSTKPFVYRSVSEYENIIDSSKIIPPKLYITKLTEKEFVSNLFQVNDYIPSKPLYFD